MSQTTLSARDEALACLKDGARCALLPSEIRNLFSIGAKPLERGDKGEAVKLLQEWLALNDQAVKIDGDFGPATQSALIAFQTRENISPTGVASTETFEKLFNPLFESLFVQSKPADLAESILSTARAHLAQHPREIGGDNRGPWVRLYMENNEGSQWYWCAGFVFFILKQAYARIGLNMSEKLFRSTFSCDILAQRAKQAGRFVPGATLAASPSAMPAPAIFLIRNTDTDWTHTGLVTAFGAETFATIEGNTNDEGTRNGYEVCSRTRSYRKVDFVSLL